VATLTYTPATTKVELFQSSIIKWFADNGRDFPWRRTHDPFLVLTAEILLKLTGAWKVEPIYGHIISKFGTPGRMANASQDELATIFKPLGLHSRVNMLINLARQINDQFNGRVPKTYDELTSLNGVGQYIANAVLCLAYRKRVPLVDGSVSRLFRRCFDYSTDKEAYADKKLWQMAEAFLPKKHYREYNLGLLDIAALICRHPTPRCHACPISIICTKDNKQLEVNHANGI
jgi:A/G-specific adenine glycosylase